MCVTIAYRQIVHANTSVYATAYTIDISVETEPPIRMHAELVMFFERIADIKGKSRPKHQLAINAKIHCRFVNPNDWNFLYTIHRNLSSAISMVVIFDMEIEHIKITPMVLHN